MKAKIDKKWLFDYYSSQAEDVHRMYGGGGFREHKQIRRLRLIRMLASALPLRNARILDLGCGDGHAAASILEGIPVRYVGIDYSCRKLKHAAELFQGVCTIGGDAECLPLCSGSMDAVLCLETLEHLIDPGASIAEISRVLKQDGIGIISVPINSSLQPYLRRSIRAVRNSGVFDEHVQSLTMPLLKQLLEENGFQVERAFFCGFNLPLINRLSDRLPYGFFEKMDDLLSRLPLSYTGFGIQWRISLGIGNEYVIVLARKGNM